MKLSRPTPCPSCVASRAARTRSRHPLDASPKPRKWPDAIVALQHRDFRLLWSSQLVSMAGTMMQSAAILWHVSILVPASQRGIALGMVGLVRVLPIIGFSLVSGVVADAMDRRRLMFITQTGMMACAIALAVLDGLGVHALWTVYALSALGAAFAAFDGPARQSLIPNLVPAEHLPNAIALNTTMFQIAWVIGPAAAGLVIASLGVGAAYAINAVTFLAVIAALFAMHHVESRAPHERATVSLAAAAEGLRFVFTRPLIRSTMLLDFVATFFASATALLPIFAQDILKVGAHGYGWLSAAPAVGSTLTSVILLRAIEGIERRGRVLLIGVVMYGVATVAFGLSHAYWLTFLCLALTGAADTVSMVIRNIIRQTHTPDTMRGRMTSVNMVFFMGGPQLGELEAGAVAQRWGAVASVVSGGIACIIAAAAVAWRTPMLRAYRRDSEVTTG